MTDAPTKETLLAALLEVAAPSPDAEAYIESVFAELSVSPNDVDGYDDEADQRFVQFLNQSCTIDAAPWEPTCKREFQDFEDEGRMTTYTYLAFDTVVVLLQHQVDYATSDQFRSGVRIEVQNAVSRRWAHRLVRRRAEADFGTAWRQPIRRLEEDEFVRRTFVKHLSPALRAELAKALAP